MISLIGRPIIESLSPFTYLSKSCLEVTENIYDKVFKKTVKSKNLKIAEFSKLLENIYRAVNIGFINEMKLVADKMGIDIFEIIKVENSLSFWIVIPS